MTKWKYNLSDSTSKRLRNAIDNEDYAEVKQALIDAYNEIYELIGDDSIFDEYDRDRYIEDVEYLNAEPEDIDTSWEDIEDDFNYELDNFFDFCDNLRVWVGLA